MEHWIVTVAHQPDEFAQQITSIVGIASNRTNARKAVEEQVERILRSPYFEIAEAVSMRMPAGMGIYEYLTVKEEIGYGEVRVGAYPLKVDDFYFDDADDLMSDGGY